MRSTPDRADRAATQAMATGALNIAFFGAVWTAAGSGGIGGAAGVGVLVVGWTLAVVLCVRSVRLRRGARPSPRRFSPAPGPPAKHPRKVQFGVRPGVLGHCRGGFPARASGST